MVENIWLNHPKNIYIGSQHRKPVPEEFVYDRGTLADYKMSTTASLASRAYCEAMFGQNIKVPSFDEMLKKLDSANVRYNFNRTANGNYFIEILNKNNNLVKQEFNWNNGKEAKDYAGCTDYQYNGLRRTGYVHHYCGKPLIINKTYYNDEIPQKTLTKEGITFKTKPQEYLKYLKTNNITFSIRKYLGKLEIQEYDKNHIAYQNISWTIPVQGYEYKNPEIRFLNPNGEDLKRIYFNDYKTEVTCYIDKRN